MRVRALRHLEASFKAEKTIQAQVLAQLEKKKEELIEAQREIREWKFQLEKYKLQEDTIKHHELTIEGSLFFVCIVFMLTHVLILCLRAVELESEKKGLNEVIELLRKNIFQGDGIEKERINKLVAEYSAEKQVCVTSSVDEYCMCVHSRVVFVR